MVALARERLALTPQPAPSLLRSVIGNALSLTGGRILLAALRFVVALVVAERAGLERFGEFALILAFVLLAEWLSDFGLGDIAVRRAAAGERGALSAFAVCKAVQSLLAGGALVAAVVLLGYSPPMVRAALVAAGAVVLYGGVQVYRAQFRLQMAMEREVGAEIFGTAVFLGAVWWVTGQHASLEALAACYVAGRAVNLLAAAVLARGRTSLGFGPGWREELRPMAAACLPLGLTGLLVAAYDAMDAIALAHWSTSGEVGTFTVAMRVVMLAVVAEQALATAVFPVLAALWQKDREAFARTLQVVLDWGVLVGGALFCALHAGAHGLGALVRQDPAGVAAVLQVLAWAILARGIVTLVSPMVVIAGRLGYTAGITLLVVAAKAAALAAMAPQGAMGAAAAYLVAEVAVGLVPTVILCQRAAGVRLAWSVPIRLLALAAAVAVAAAWLGSNSIAHGALAAAAFLALATAVGAVRLQPLRELIASVARRRGGRA